MRRVLLISCIMLFTVTVKAQLYAGGSVGIGLVKQSNTDGETTFKIIPEIGYNINENWAVGIALGYKNGSCLVGKSYYEQNVKTKAVGFQPYVRYNPIHVSIVDLFVDGCLTYEYIIDEGYNMNLGFRPGIIISPIKQLSIVTHLGFIGAELYKNKDDGYKKEIVGFDIDTSNFTLGMYYNF